VNAQYSVFKKVKSFNHNEKPYIFNNLLLTFLVGRQELKERQRLKSKSRKNLFSQ